MKGLVEKSNDGIFLVIKHGGIVRESKHPQEGFEPIEVTNPRTSTTFTKYIKRYKAVDALIRKIEWYDREYDGTPYQGWKLLLDADGTICTLDLPFESNVGTRFMKLAENIDYSQPVEFSAWKAADDKTAFSVKQNGEKVNQKYSREDPGDCPPPVIGFNKKLNFDAEKAFLHAQMVNVVIPKVVALNGNGHHETTSEQAPPTDKKENVLKAIQSDLKDYVAQGNVSLNDAIETWFGTRVWAEVEKMDLATLEPFAKKLDDAIAPF